MLPQKKKASLLPADGLIAWHFISWLVVFYGSFFLSPACLD
jgi:hypothetical protein